MRWLCGTKFTSASSLVPVQLPRPGADLGLLAGGGVSVSRSYNYVVLLTNRGGGGDTCVVLLTEGLILAGC